MKKWIASFEKKEDATGFVPGLPDKHEIWLHENGRFYVHYENGYEELICCRCPDNFTENEKIDYILSVSNYDNRWNMTARI